MNTSAMSVDFFDPIGIGILAGLTVVAFVLGLIIAGIKKGTKDERGSAIIFAGEAAVLTLLGALLARATITGGFALLGPKPGTAHVLAWAFLLWPGLVDLAGRAFTGSFFIEPQTLLFLAGLTGGLTGMMNGLWRIHDWKGLGWFAFPLDVTWGLAGNVNGLLLHAINQFAADDHPYEPRQEVQRYVSGFGLKSKFRFTQGCVMSNTETHDVPGSKLFSHERTHVWQNRAAGPFYTLSYVGWMLVWLVPAFIVGLVTRVSPFGVMNIWCYFNNPWEVWAYSSSGDSRSWADTSGKLLWSPPTVMAMAVLIYGLFLLAGYLAIKS